jgi:hypothetical protein
MKWKRRLNKIEALHNFFADGGWGLSGSPVGLEQRVIKESARY